MPREMEKHAALPRKKRRRGRMRRFFRGYLMTIGALTTTYGLLRLIVWLFVEISRVYGLPLR